MRTLLSILVLVVAGLLVATWWVSRPGFQEPLETSSAALDVLPLTEALTLAMSVSGKVLLVLSADETSIQAVDINEQLQGAFPDTVAAYEQLGYERLAGLGSGSTRRLALDELGLPLVPSYPHIAAGTNYRAHAEEVGLDGEPFLFPKLSRATAWNAAVPKRTRLDYEVELCAVPLATYTLAEPAKLGFVLCNDFTDRWTLLREIDLDQPMGLTGFPAAKGGAGMLPVGPFLVVPRDDQTFHRDVQLQLGANGTLRQRASAGLMIWHPHEIAQKALGQCDDAFQRGGETVRLTRCAGIEAGTLILTGTPAGVMFHFVNIWAAPAYLRSDDQVIAFADHLGVLRNRIQAE